MTPGTSRQQQISARNATRMLKGIVTSKFSNLSVRGYETETNISVDSRANLKDIPATYRADRFDDLPDFPTLMNSRRSDRRGVWADNRFWSP